MLSSARFGVKRSLMGVKMLCSAREAANSGVIATVLGFP